MQRLTGWIVRVVAVVMAGFHIYTAYAGTFYPYVQRGLPLLFSLILTFLTVSAWKTEGDKHQPTLLDWLLVVLTVPAVGYVVFNVDHLMNRWPLTPTFAPTTLEIGLGVLTMVLLLEATRRLMGSVLVVVVALAILYALFGEYVPFAELRHRGFTVQHVTDYLYLTDQGVWGTSLDIAVTFIVLFIIFSAFAERAGAAEFFIQFANALTGHTRGGPAKVAIISSAMVGSVTGSTVANVYTTGQFTIPLMKRTGYPPAMAGAVEALASNGGQIMPPVLGSTAFLVAADSGVSYTTVVLACILPALIYYGGLLWYMHLEAINRDLHGIPIEEKPSVVAVLKQGAHLMAPIVVLFGGLIWGLSPTRAALYSIGATVVVSWFRKATRLGPKEIIEAMELGAKGGALMVVICAVLGYVIGTFTLTGLGLNITSAIISVSQGLFLLTLFLVFAACFILGMGMNAVAAYILASAIGVPALAMFKVDPLVANIFVFYASILSHITPPVCLAVFAGAQIAGANMWETAWYAVRMGTVAYVLPFLVVFLPSLLLIGSAIDILIETITAIIGLGLIITAVQGWAGYRLNWPERLWFVVTGGCFVSPDLMVTGIGAASGAALGAVVFMRARRKVPAKAA
ncbi:MAG: TRAP transporter permease [Alphaproteobacteria bacterium]|nr:TRAP transporter permease [Alphaproteobacteria bacterium]